MTLLYHDIEFSMFNPNKHSEFYAVGDILCALIPDQYVTYIDRSVIDNNVERSRGCWNG